MVRNQQSYKKVPQHVSNQGAAPRLHENSDETESRLVSQAAIATISTTLKHQVAQAAGGFRWSSTAREGRDPRLRYYYSGKPLPF